MTLQSNLSAVEINPSTKPEATIIWLHGLGADGHEFVDIVPQLNLPNVRFIFPHAPVRPITLNGGYPMRGWYDIYDLIDRSREDEIGVRESAELIDALIQREIDNGIPTEKILLAGFSQGCAMALYSGLRYPKKLGGILGLSGYLPLAKTLASEASELNKTIPIFMVQRIAGRGRHGWSRRRRDPGLGVGRCTGDGKQRRDRAKRAYPHPGAQHWQHALIGAILDGSSLRPTTAADEALPHDRLPGEPARHRGREDLARTR